MNMLVTILTHGNELIGLRVAEQLKEWGLPEALLRVQVANPRAYEAGKRFIDQDLNRSFPGTAEGNYEQRLAYELLPMVKAAGVVVDIHSTTSLLKDAVIVTKLDEPTRRCVEAIGPKYVLVMEVTGETALISGATIGLAFEYGKDTSKQAAEKVVEDIGRLACFMGLMEGKVRRRRRATTTFRVVAEVKKPDGYRLVEGIENYRLVTKGQVYATKGNEALRATEDFYPILFGQDNYETIFGFEGRVLL